MAKEIKTKVVRMEDQPNLFGIEMEKDPILRDRYVEPPFNVFDSKQAGWQRRRKIWRQWLKVESSSGEYGMGKDDQEDGGVDEKIRASGIKAEEVEMTNSFRNLGKTKAMKIADEAVFDPSLLEVIYSFYCPEGGSIIDTFTGSHISGCVAHKLGFKFTGIDVRQIIVDQNYAKAREIIPENMPTWLVGNSNNVLDDLVFEEFDLFNSCPPYSDLVKYSKKNPIEGDISLLKYEDFMPIYSSIIKKGCGLLKPGGYAVFTVGEVRDKKTGELYGFVPDTVTAFKEAGMIYYNNAVLLNSLGTAPMRAKGTFERGDGKLVPVHQDVLVFKKPG